MPWDSSSAPEPVQKLMPEQRAVWVEVANRSLDEGYDEGQAIAIAYSVAKRMDGCELMLSYPAWRPGTYTAAVGGEFEVTREDCTQMGDAINRLYNLGHPVALINGHGSGDAVGIMPAARMDGDVLRAALVCDWWVAAGIREGTFGLSVEANRDYSSEAYTAGETYTYWPTAWAVLPAGEQPAVPPGEPLAAKEPDKPVRLFAQEAAPDRGELPQGKEADQMDKEMEARLEKLEAAQTESAEKITALESERDELKAKLEAAEKERDELKSAKEQAEIEAAEAAVNDRVKTIMAAEARPGVRERMQAKLEAAEGVDAKAALLEAWELTIGETELEQAKLRASEAKPEGSEADSADNLIDEAKRIQAAEKCDWNTALEAAIKKAGE